MKIKSIHNEHFRNNEHFQFYTEVKDLITAAKAEDLKIEELFQAFLSAYADEDEAFAKIIKSATTEEIEAADKIRDQTFRGMIETNNAALKHFNAGQRTAAKRLKVVFDTYGNLARKPLQEETSAIYNLLQELSGKYTDDAQQTGIDKWAAQLDTDNKAFESLVKIRNDENASKTELKMKQTRTALDNVYNTIVERINALIIVEGTANYETFVRKLNTFIDMYNQGLAKRS